MSLELSDNMKSREQDKHGVYHYVKKGENEREMDSQSILMEESNDIKDVVED